ncbi:MAG: C25 family cysteine peptidase [Bacteroidota bacterium]
MKMIKPLQILLFILFFFLSKASLLVADDPVFFVKTPSEGIFKFTSPYPSNTRVVIQNDDECYVVSPSKNQSIYFYSAKASSYLIGAVSKECPCNFVSYFPKEKVFGERNKYRNEVRPSTDNWFHAIINKKTDFNFYQKNPNFSKKIEVSVKLYNFNEKFITAFLSSGDEMHKIALVPHEEKKVKFLLNVQRDVLKFDVFSKNNLGIKSVSLSNSGKELSEITSLEIFNPPYEVIHTHQRIHFFYFDEEELKQTTNIHEAKGKNVLAIKDSYVKDISLQKVEPIPGISENTVIIYHELFESAIPKLEDHLRSKGYNSYAVNAQNIYNHFGNSLKSPQSIKRFLIANNVKRCILVGDSYVDETSSKDLVPSFVHYTQDRTRILSDYYYSYTKHPLEPSIEVSRLPFKNISELNNYVNTLRKTTISNGSEYLVLCNAKIIYEKSLPTSFTFNANNLDDIVNKNNPKLVFHLGHGNELAWEGEELIKERSFRNINISYELIDFSCWTGAFGLRKYDSLTESLLKLKKGGPSSIISSYGPLKLGRMSTLFGAYKKNTGNDHLSKRNLKAKQWLCKNHPGFIDELYNLNLFGLGV